MSISTAEQKQYLDKIVELAKFRADGYEAWWKDANLGTSTPNDEQFRLWYETQVRMQGPDWERCLTGVQRDGKTPMVKGGQQVVKRYQRILMGGQMKPQQSQMQLPPLQMGQVF